jgi:hypothetical protein
MREAREVHMLGPSVRSKAIVAGVLLASCGALAMAQQTTIGTRSNTVSDGFYEHTGVSWGISSGNFRAYFGTPMLTQPTAGGYQPGSGPTLSYTFQGRGTSGYFNLFASQGSTRTAASQSPSVTLMNGQQAFVSDTVQSPFVMGLMPVVGGNAGPAMVSTAVQLPTFSLYGVGSSVCVPSGGSALIGSINGGGDGRRQFGDAGVPSGRSIGGDRSASNVRGSATVHDLAEMDRQLLAGSSAESTAQARTSADSSSAARAAPSVAASRRLYAAEQAGAQDDAAEWFDRAKAAEAEGKLGAAKVYYQIVARRASGDLKAQALDRLQTLRGQSSSATPVDENPR